MKRAPAFIALLFLASTLHAGDWEEVAPGVEYRHYLGAGRDIHVARIDMTSRASRVVSTQENERGAEVSDFAKKKKAIIAINGDYFDPKFQPVGLAIGPCGRWADTPSTSVRRQGLVGFGDGQVMVRRYTDDGPVAQWVTNGVSGWPILVEGCQVFTAKQLPGSDHFTRAPHPRTAVGSSWTGRFVYFVVADGRRETIPGMTLEDLGMFMRNELGVCSAINLDGGGSSAMWVRDRIVTVPSDVAERKVGNHLAVIARADDPGCVK